MLCVDNMTIYSPLTKILDEKLIHVLDDDPPPSILRDDASKEEKEAYVQWHEYNSLAKCYL